MAASSAIPPQAAIALNNLVDGCAHIEPGQHVLILAAVDGLHGGRNVVDELAISWIQAAVQLRGAHAYVLWADMPSRPEFRWGEGVDASQVWTVPPVIRSAIAGADVIINCIIALRMEDEIHELMEMFGGVKAHMVMNYATTAALLTSDWAQAPHEIIAEIRIRVADLLVPGEQWTLTHPNGTDIRGVIAKPGSGLDSYAYHRGKTKPFPEGVFPSTGSIDAEGVAVIEEIGAIWANRIGLPSPFKEPVRFTLEKGAIRSIDGGEEAAVLRRFYEYMTRYLGDAGYRMRGFHGGVHPFAQVGRHLCPNDTYWRVIEHHHWSSFHIHLGDGPSTFPYRMHITGEYRGGDLKAGDRYIYKDGRLTALDDPKVREVAQRYPDWTNLGPDPEVRPA